MTDISSRNIEAWQDHPGFEDLVQMGLLDFAFYNPVEDNSFSLIVSGESLESKPQPMIAIANYVFDGIEQDLFELSDGQLNECLVSVNQGPTSAREKLASLNFQFIHQPSNLNHYSNNTWNKILKNYETLPDGAVLFPVGALKCIENLRALSQDHLYLISADKGVSKFEQLKSAPMPLIAKHGSISLSVNYHALVQYTHHSNGIVQESPIPYSSLNILGFIFDSQRKSFPETDNAYQNWIIRSGPDDIYLSKKRLIKGSSDLCLHEALSFLRITYWDAKVLKELYPRLVEIITSEPSSLWPILEAGFQKSWLQHLDLNDEDDFAFLLGNLMAAMGCYSHAYHFFKTSLAIHGENECVLENINLCRKFSNIKDNGPCLTE